MAELECQSFKRRVRSDRPLFAEHCGLAMSSSSLHASGPTHWAVSVPIEEGSDAATTLRELFAATKDKKAAARGKNKPLAELTQFDVPEGLQVGTLDELLRLADALEALGTQSTALLHSHEAELVGATRRSPGSSSAAAPAASAPASLTALVVEGLPVLEWVKKSFRWDTAVYDPREGLRTLMQRIRDVIVSLDHQRREQGASLAQARHDLNMAQRASVGGLLAKPLAWLLTKRVIQDTRLADRFFDFGPSATGADHYSPLRTEFVVVRPGKEAEFLERYESVGAGTVAASIPAIAESPDAAVAESKSDSLEEMRASLVAAAPRSPVVPRSAFKVLETAAPDAAPGASVATPKESLWIVTVLSSCVSQFRSAAARDGRGIFDVKADVDEDGMQRSVLRSRILGASRTGGAAEAEAALERSEQDAAATVAELQARLADAEARMLRDCQARYEESLRTHLHLVAIQLFVESILRYGLPVHFAYALLRPKEAATEPLLLAQLHDAYKKLDDGGDDDDEKPSGAGLTANRFGKKLPLVHVTCEVRGEA
jgi:hypothetical protein